MEHGIGVGELNNMHIVIDGSSLQTRDLDANSSAIKRLDDVEFILHEILQEFIESDAETIMFSPRTEPNSRAVYNKLIYCDSNSLKEYTDKYEDISCLIHVGYHRQYDVPFNAKLNIDLSLGISGMYSPEYIAKMDYVCYFTEYQATFLKMTGFSSEKLIKLSYPISSNTECDTPCEHFDIIYPGLPHNGIQHFVNIIKDCKGLKIGIPESTKKWVEAFRFDNYWQGESVAKFLEAMKTIKPHYIKYYDDSSNNAVFSAIQNSDTMIYPYESQQPTEFTCVAGLYGVSIGKQLLTSPNDCLKEVFDKKAHCKVINSCKNYAEFIKSIGQPTGNTGKLEGNTNEVAWQIYSLIRDNI